MSVRGNELERITVEELKAMPRLAGLDARGNPMSCDTDLSGAIQWLSSHGVMPTEIVRSLNYQDVEYNVKYETISQWSDLEKLICENDYDGPPARPLPRKPPTSSPSASFDDDNDEDDDDNNDDTINTVNKFNLVNKFQLIIIYIEGFLIKKIFFSITDQSWNTFL